MIVATVQIILNVIRHGFVKISNFNLMVFDECHHATKGNNRIYVHHIIVLTFVYFHATKEHPMLMLMAKFKDYPESDLPRIIGLTGIPTTASIKPKNVVEDLARLEATFRATITTATGNSFDNVLQHSTKPVESVILYNQCVASSFHAFIERKRDEMRKLIDIWSDMEKQPKIHEKFMTILDDFYFEVGNLGKCKKMIQMICEWIKSKKNNFEISIQDSMVECYQI